MKQNLFSIIFIVFLFSGCTVQNPELMQAVKDGNVRIVQTLLSDNSTVNARDENGWTALNWAATKGHTQVVKLLIEKGADVDAKDSGNGQTPLWKASHEGHTAIVKLLLENGADVNKRNASGETALWTASWKGHTDVVRLLLERGANANLTQTETGITPLWIASQEGYLDIVKLLLENGAGVDVKKKDTGTTALWLASQNGHAEVAKFLLENGAEVNVKRSDIGVTALYIASEKGQTEVVKLLLDNGADVDIETGIDGTTALWQAAWHGHTDVVRLLLNAGAEIDAKRDADRVTALWQASYHGHADVVKFLLDKGADVNVRRIPTGTTPLWVASYNGHADVVKLLVAADAEVNVDAKATEQSKICTPLATALEKGHVEVVRLLLDNGADVSVEQSIDIEAALWKDAKKSYTSRAYEDFLERYPNSEFVAEARAKIKKLAAEEKARTQRLEEEERLRRTFAERKAKVASLLANASTSSQFEELLTSQPDMVEFILPKLERKIVDDIIENGVGSRLVVSGIKTETASPSSVTISDDGGVWKLEMEQPSDRILQINMRPSIFGSGSIHRFSGEVKYDNIKLPSFVGTGDERNRLTFLLLKDTGYVYMRGKGRLVFPHGQTVELGFKEALATTKKGRETLEITSSEKTHDKDSSQSLIQISDERKVETLKSGTVGYREIVQDNEKELLSENPKIKSKPEDINIKVTTVSAKVSHQSRTQKTENGIFQMRPDPSITPTGHIEINYTVNDEPKSIKTDVTRIFTLGEDYLYYIFGCDNGNAYQSSSTYQSNINIIIPFVKSMKEYNELDDNIAKKLYLDDNIEKKELAVWMIWKLNSGKEIDGILHDLTNGNIDKKRLSAKFIAQLRIYHPLINQAVQKRLHELEYNAGLIDGSLSTDTIKAIKQFQKDNSIDDTGWLDESTLFKMFATATERPSK